MASYFEAVSLLFGQVVRHLRNVVRGTQRSAGDRLTVDPSAPDRLAHDEPCARRSMPPQQETEHQVERPGRIRSSDIHFSAPPVRPAREALWRLRLRPG